MTECAAGDTDPQILIEDTVVESEGASGETKPATFDVLLSAPSGQQITVNYTTVSATAQAVQSGTLPADYVTKTACSRSPPASRWPRSP